MARERWAEDAFAGLCRYEAYAIETGLLPTVSQVCRRHRWVEAVLLGFLVVHLHHAVKDAAVLDGAPLTGEPLGDATIGTVSAA